MFIELRGVFFHIGNGYELVLLVSTKVGYKHRSMGWSCLV